MNSSNSTTYNNKVWGWVTLSWEINPSEDSSISFNYSGYQSVFSEPAMSTSLENLGELQILRTKNLGSRAQQCVFLIINL